MNQYHQYIGMVKQEVNQPIAFPSQHQNPTGLEYLMDPRPVFDSPGYVGNGKLKGKVAIITGGDSGFGRAIAVAFAKEGANLTILYLNEHRDAEETKEYVEKLGASCELMPGDLREPSFSKSAADHTIKTYQQLDIVVNNAAVQPYTEDIMDVSDEQLENTFRTNVYPLFLIKNNLNP